jgi:predicted nucleotidyltransferase
MLEKLFTSKTRVKLLQLFVLNPAKRFTQAEITSNLKLKPAALKNELENLQKLGLISSASQAADSATESDEKENRRPPQFMSNTEFTLFDELRALIIKSQFLNQQSLIERISRLGRVKLLLLTGVFVNNPLSPIDLLVVGRINKAQLVKQIRELERELGKELNFTYLDTSEFIYRRNMTDVFLYDILEGKKIILIDELNR